jgi:N-dimethylarginine dimethylaminohydrolase
LKNMTVINTNVLMSDANNFGNELPINPYYSHESVDVSKAIREHATIQSFLETAGVTVQRVSSPLTSQDGVYTANWALTRGKKAVLARLPNARKSEEDWAETQLSKLGMEVIRVPADWRFSGQGDALACGNILFCGSTYRSDERAQAFAAELLGYQRVQLRTIPQLSPSGEEVINRSSGWPDSFYYDIDLALSIIKPPTETEKGLIAYCPEAFTPESRHVLENFTAVDTILVSEAEATHAFACNLISTGSTVIMSAHAPKLKAELERRGLAVVTPEIAELAKGGGYIRCTTLSFND